MTKRNLFEELKQGFEEMGLHLEGKITLRTETLEKPSPITITPEEVKAIRQRLNLSQAVFARKLRTSVRTFQAWEQGKTKTSAHASLLLRMVDKAPQTFELIAVI